jgi:cyclopropane-fatty-acyl-phospholipid synthase
MGSAFRRVIERRVAGAGIHIGGDEPWDVRVHNPRLYARVLAMGTVGLGDAYMDGWWDCDAIDEMVARVQAADVVTKFSSVHVRFGEIDSRIRNRQTRIRSQAVARNDYDVGNDLFDRMLDRRMLYSCGYWRSASDLDAAQEAKLALIANKLGLEPGMRVLDIGCGWGGAAAYFAEAHGCEVVGVTISQRQAELARHRCADLPVDIRVEDYREIDEQFDRVYSIGMFEHVGVKNYRTYMDVCRRCLRDPDGLMLLHTIGASQSRHSSDPWIERHIFPNSMLPSAVQITEAAEEMLELQDWQNLGADYDPTLMAWHRNVEAAWGGSSPAMTSAFGACGGSTCCRPRAASGRADCSFGRSSCRAPASPGRIALTASAERSGCSQRSSTRQTVTNLAAERTSTRSISRGRLVATR